MTKEALSQLRLVKSLQFKDNPAVDKDAEYVRGFTDACEKKQVDPQRLIEMVDVLELSL